MQRPLHVAWTIAMAFGTVPAVADGTEALWSFAPTSEQSLPVVERHPWPRERIDHFVLANLEANGLSPSKDAEKRAWLRRATLDTTGLPATPQSVEAFLDDDGPEAHARAIDRLLASPRYGERWARFWLDLARYADIDASWLGTSENAWLYRDWVVRALNENVGYDAFSKRQLAADQMENAAPEDTAALGFIGLSPGYWKELRLAPDVIRTVVAEEYDERIDTVCRTFLGLTASCARCHDHKFDPISMRDYYALAGVFASTKLADRSLLPPKQADRVREAKRRVAVIEQEVAALSKTSKLSEASSGVKEREAQVAQLRAEALRLRETPGFDLPLAHGVRDAALWVEADGPHKTKLVYKDGESRDMPIYRGGNAARRGEIIPRGFLSALTRDESRTFRQGSGRRELAEAIFSDAAPLAARVFVNRVWRQFFGEGLVGTPSDFGTQGSRPTHPRLLEDLAHRFKVDGWNIKALHREILLSSTYRQSSVADPSKAAVDPENRWLWRQRPRRLSVESWRDSILIATGELDLRIGGKPADLLEPGNRRRSLYGRIARRDLNMLLRLYDFPDPAAHSPGRLPTTTPLQQLFVLNSDFMAARAKTLREKIFRTSESHRGRIDAIYDRVFGRPPTDRERVAAADFLSRENDIARWDLYCHALLATSELLFTP